MLKLIKLTPANSNCGDAIFVNIYAIESVFQPDDCTHINFIGGDSSYTNVKESLETVVKLAEEEA